MGTNVDLKIKGVLGSLEVGDDLPVRVVGVINVSPESFYKGSVVSFNELEDYVLRLVSEGCDIIDVGGRSTAPYLSTEIPIEEEVRRVTRAVSIIKDLTNVPVSVDTFRAKVAEEALKLDVEIINDVTGLKGDKDMIKVIKDYKPSLILCAREIKTRPDLDPVSRVINALRESLEMLINIDYDLSKVVIDPCIGFFRYPEIPWYVWDLQVLANLSALRVLGRPIAIGVSRKSFIGVMTGREDPKDRLFGSIAYTVIALLQGVHVVRTHDVAPTKDVIKAINGFRKYGITLKLHSNSLALDTTLQ